MCVGHVNMCGGACRSQRRTDPDCHSLGALCDLLLMSETESLTDLKLIELNKMAGQSNPKGLPVSTSFCWDYKCMQ